MSRVMVCEPCTYGEYANSGILRDTPGFKVQQYNGKVGWVAVSFLSRITCTTGC